MAGLPLPQPAAIEGVDFTALLQGAAALDRAAIFWHYPHYGNQGGTPGSAVRSGDYKLIEFFEEARLELYNLRTDLSEEHNLVAEEPQITAQLHHLLRDWRAAVEAKLPAPNPDYGP